MDAPEALAPEPESAADCVPAPPLSESVTISVPVSVPDVPGVNVTPIVHWPLGASAVQLLVWAKFPLATMLPMVRVLEPL